MRWPGYVSMPCVNSKSQKWWFIFEDSLVLITGFLVGFTKVMHVVIEVTYLFIVKWRRMDLDFAITPVHCFMPHTYCGGSSRFIYSCTDIFSQLISIYCELPGQWTGKKRPLVTDELLIRAIFGHNQLRSYYLQVQPVTCWHPSISLH